MQYKQVWAVVLSKRGCLRASLFSSSWCKTAGTILSHSLHCPETFWLTVSGEGKKDFQSCDINPERRWGIAKNKWRGHGVSLMLLTLKYRQRGNYPQNSGLITGRGVTSVTQALCSTRHSQCLSEFFFSAKESDFFHTDIMLTWGGGRAL